MILLNYSKFLFVLLIIMSNSVLAFNEEELRSQIIRDQIEQTIETEKEVLRETERYKRIYNICSETIEFSKTQYAWESAKQISNLIFNPLDEVAHINETKKTVSKRLHHDLTSKEFLLATSDCGYSSQQKNDLILSLIIMDSSGKILGAVGVVKVMKWLNSARLLLQAKSKNLMRVLYSLGFGMGTYTLYNMYQSKDEVSVNKNNKNAIKVNKDNFSEIFQTETIDSTTIAIANSIEEKAIKKISKLEKLLESDDLSEIERAKLEKKLEKYVRLKIKMQLRRS